MSEQQPAGESQPQVENKEAGEKKPQKRGGRGFGKGKGNRRGPRDQKEDEWTPLTNLGRLVKMGKVKKLEQIFYHSIPIKEYQIVDELMKVNNKTLREECMKSNQSRNKQKPDKEPDSRQ